MTATLPKADRERLARLLALLSSSFIGERDNAGQAAQRLLDRHGLTWADVVDPAPVGQTQPGMGVWRQTCARLLEQSEQLRAWEIGFVRDLPQFRRISTKQRYVLEEIRVRVLGGES